MKKLIFGACAALMLVGASCSKGNATESTTKIPKEISDSVSMYSGSTLGAYVLSDYLNYIKTSDNDVSKASILKGIQIALANDDEATVIGLQIGAQVLSQFKRFEEQGIEVNRNEFLKNFRRVFEADTVNMDALATENSIMTELMGRVQTIVDERKQAEQASQVEAAKEEAAKYIENLRAEDPEIKTSASGLAYKIVNPGEEPFVQDNSAIDVYYTGKLVDGTVFDQTKDSPATFSPSGVIPGFAEGLKLLGKGGKATLYIPGDLAYGPNGIPQIGIGPNAMLIFDVEVVDVRNPE